MKGSRCQSLYNCKLELCPFLLSLCHSEITSCFNLSDHILANMSLTENKGSCQYKKGKTLNQSLLLVQYSGGRAIELPYICPYDLYLTNQPFIVLTVLMMKEGKPYIEDFVAGDC